jgi:hypothetical protein
MHAGLVSKSAPMNGAKIYNSVDNNERLKSIDGSLQSLITLLSDLDLTQLHTASEDGDKLATIALTLIYGRTYYSGIPYNFNTELLRNTFGELPNETAYSPQIQLALRKFEDAPIDFVKVARYLHDLVTNNSKELVECVWDSHDLTLGLLEKCSGQLEEMALSGNEIAITAWNTMATLNADFSPLSNLVHGLGRAKS